MTFFPRHPKSVLPAAIALALFAAAGAPRAQDPIPVKVACIGNSITEGVGTTNSAVYSYPSRLRAALGAEYTVLNAGVSGRTLLRKGDFPYWTQGRLPQVFVRQPDIITIKLGTNDTKPQNWQYGSEFAADLVSLIDTLSAMPSQPQIWLCLPVPIFPNTFGIRSSILVNNVIPLIQMVADGMGLPVIDLYTPLKDHPELFPDGVHPNNDGADSIAAIIHRELTKPVSLRSAHGPRRANPRAGLMPMVPMVRGTLPAGFGEADALFAPNGRRAETSRLPLASGAYLMRAPAGGPAVR